MACFDVQVPQGWNQILPFRTYYIGEKFEALCGSSICADRWRRFFAARASFGKSGLSFLSG
ncbi:hypothetical protein SAMN04488040_1264 [Sulfitobacter marinus]|uniref:Uncharacterized protein n=1 Tax=Sulfitobacter marinus TaxID=394264 RepID=A0A1I6RI57_9RHOB|nr:hypothetical protein SAMN04488040_1264 [Sulfitobacter marinus]